MASLERVTCLFDSDVYCGSLRWTRIVMVFALTSC